MSMLQHIRWWQIAFIVVMGSLSVGAFALLERSSFSSHNVRVVVEGVDQIAAGKENTIRVGVENQTTVALTSVQLTIDLPSNMITSDGRRFAIFHWDSVSGGKKELQDLIVVAHAGENEGTLRGRLDYAPKGFTGRFVSTAEFKITPIALGITSVFDLPSSAVPGQEIEGTIYIIPTDKLAFGALWLELAPPEDFSIQESSPALDDNTRWHIEHVENGKEYSFRFRGVVRGAIGEDKEFRAGIGSMKEGNFVALAYAKSTVRLSNAPLHIEQHVDGFENGLVSPGDKISVTLNYENAGDTAISDTAIEAYLNGAAFDFSRFSSDDGVFDQRTHTVAWNKTNLPVLQILDPGEKGTVRFTIYIQQSLQPANAKDINFTLSIRARIHSPQQSLALGGVALEDEKITMLRVASVLSLNAQAYRQLSGMSNTGPVPPRVGQETTYIIVWQIKNTTNDVSSVRAESVLPPGVSWKGVLDPPDAKVSYSADTRTILWDAGIISAGTGNIFPVQKVRFQVGLIPALDQVGKSALLMSNSKITGTDTLTQQTLEIVAHALDTTLPDDPFASGGGIVQL